MCYYMIYFLLMNSLISIFLPFPKYQNERYINL